MLSLIKNTLVTSCVLATFGCCCGVSEPWGGDDVDLQQVRQYAERGEVSELLGEPDGTEIWEGGRIDAYEIWEGTKVLLSIPEVPIPLEVVYSYLTVAYYEDGSLLGLETSQADSPE